MYKLNKDLSLPLKFFPKGTAKTKEQWELILPYGIFFDDVKDWFEQ